jgi:hypothetical protein
MFAKAGFAGGVMRRRLRLIATAIGAVACLLLVLFWAQSYYGSAKKLRLFDTTVRSFRGEVACTYFSTNASGGLKVDRIRVPYLGLVLATAAVAGLPWVEWSRRFSLRTFLIALTLVAVILAALLAA